MSDHYCARPTEKIISVPLEGDGISDSALSEDDRGWSFQRFKYEFFLCLSKIIDINKSNNISENERVFLSDRKYYVQAKNLIYWIPISRPSELIPPFVINLSDLTPKLKSEFEYFL